MAVKHYYEDDVMRIREICRELECFSWTSEKYQDDILSFIFGNAGEGRGIIEVGCYKGGLSALLAFACNKLNWPFYTIDIETRFVEAAKKLLKHLGCSEKVTFFSGTLKSFSKQVKLKEPPFLVVLDGDHRYEAVKKDIKSLYATSKRSYAAAFHDFSLRHPTTGELVDRAVFDCFGDDIPLLPIGGQIGEESPTGQFPDKGNPSPDGHYWERPGTEGVIIRLPDICRSF